MSELIRVKVHASAGPTNDQTDYLEIEAGDPEQAHKECLEFAIEITGFECSFFVEIPGGEISLDEWFEMRAKEGNQCG